ncbi:MAG: hypothetical protein QM601_08380 [Pseudoxanthomonas sp.]
MSLPSMRRRALITAALGLLLFAGMGVAALRGVPLDNYLGGMAAGTGAGALLMAVVLWFSPDPGNCTPPALARRYRREVVPAMAAYVVVMLFWRRLLDSVEASWLRVLVALLPAVLMLLVIRAVARRVNAADELQRRIELESIGIAACLVGGGYMTAGFLQSARLIDVPAVLAMLWVFPALCLGYGLVRIVISRRYT